jgi:hypothetical protein
MGRSVRYANPVVEKTSSSRMARFVSSPSLGGEDDKAERETMGSEEKEVDITAGVKGQEGVEGRYVGCAVESDESTLKEAIMFFSLSIFTVSILNIVMFSSFCIFMSSNTADLTSH